MRTKLQLVCEINRSFGLVAVLANEREVALYTPTNVRIMDLTIYNAGTDDEPQWNVGGFGSDGVLQVVPSEYPH